MNILFYIIYVIAGVLIGTIGVSTIVLSITMGYVYTNKLAAKGIIKNKDEIHKLSNLTIFIWGFIILVVTTVILWIDLNNIIGYGIGLFIAFLSSKKQLGFNKNNISDYIKRYINYFDADKFCELDLSISYENLTYECLCELINAYESVLTNKNL